MPSIYSTSFDTDQLTGYSSFNELETFKLKAKIALQDRCGRM